MTAAGPDLTTHLRETVRWHFDPATASPFWRDKAGTLGFDPIEEIRTPADLARFPDVSAELARVPAETLVPRGCHGPVRVFESGGTLGPPKRIIEISSRAEGVRWVSDVLGLHGVPDRGHWLHIGPAGPHIVGRSVGLLAEARGQLCFYLDFDPRWVRRCLARGDRAGADAYVQHVLAQAEDILCDQDIRVVFATPPVIEAACARPELEELLAKRVAALLWSGTSISAETLRLIEEEVFAGATVVGIYGNSMMGIAPQRPRQQTDTERCVFQPGYPYAVVDVVDPARPDEPVVYGERGRVRVSLLTRDMFLPNVAERDSAVRVPPIPGFPGDGIARVEPYRPASAGTIIEGVY